MLTVESLKKQLDNLPDNAAVYVSIGRQMAPAHVATSWDQPSEGNPGRVIIGAAGSQDDPLLTRLLDILKNAKEEQFGKPATS